VKKKTRQREAHGKAFFFAVCQTLGTRQTFWNRLEWLEPFCLPCAGRLAHGKGGPSTVHFSLPRAEENARQMY